MDIKKIIIALFCIIAIQQNGISQTDSVVKAKVLDDGSQDAEKYYNSGIADFANKNLQSALVNFNNAIQLKRNFERAWYNRGTVKFELKDFDGAISDFD